MQIGTRDFLAVEFDQHVLPASLIEKVFPFALGAIAPEDIFRFRQGLDFMYPVEHRLVGWLRIADSIWRENSERDVFHGTKISS